MQGVGIYGGRNTRINIFSIIIYYPYTERVPTTAVIFFFHTYLFINIYFFFLARFACAYIILLRYEKVSVATTCALRERRT